MSTNVSKRGRDPFRRKNPRPHEQEVTRFASVTEFAEFLGVSEATVWRRIADGTIVSVKFGGTRRIDVPASLARLSGAPGER